MKRVFAGFFCALVSLHAWAWNARGHAAVAALAQANLSPAALSAVQSLLQDDLDALERPSGRKSLASVASWADEIRELAGQSGDHKIYAGWHTRANPVCRSELGKCREGKCVDELIIHYAAVLGDPAQPLRARNEALKWVVHLVGDLHMPLHSGVNRNGGSAKVTMPGRELKADATLHSVWDSELLNAALKDWVAAPRLNAAPRLEDKAPTQWMLESRDVALEKVYQPLPGFMCDERLPEPIVLDAAYQQASTPVVRHQIELAGLRLAQLLNQVLSEVNP